MYIEGFGFSGYRSFGEELQLFGPCTKVNLLIGQNNSGKSNVLSFLNFRYEKALRDAREGTSEESHVPDTFDPHIGGSGAIQLAFGMTLKGTLYTSTIQKFSNRPIAGRIATELAAILQSRTLTRGGQVACSHTVPRDMVSGLG